MNNSFGILHDSFFLNDSSIIMNIFLNEYFLKLIDFSLYMCILEFIGETREITHELFKKELFINYSKRNIHELFQKNYSRIIQKDFLRNYQKRIIHRLFKNESFIFNLMNNELFNNS